MTDKPVHQLKSHRRRKLAKLDMNYRDNKSNGAVAWVALGWIEGMRTTKRA